ncbi:RNase H-like domain found in reverse transcriptase [Popillia japonica]|uniref:RNA-directed DNA polymerase n=1 Tax=Popillia japonica TaxID=7064 RepID=A0AAW1L729_POPJA
MKKTDFGRTLRRPKRYFEHLKSNGGAARCHILADQGISVDPARVEAIKQFRRPENKTELLRFLDASGCGIGACLFQEDSLGNREAVAYISRTLTPTERHYAQIEREALGLTWAAEKWSDFITGKTLVVADSLSRNPLNSNEDRDELEDEVQVYVNFVIANVPVKDTYLQKIITAQMTDSTCQKLREYTLQEWPDRRELSNEMLQYYQYRYEISISDDILLKNNRIVIPPSLQKEVLDLIHSGHQGIVKCRRRAFTSVWWLGLSTQLANLIKSCPNCIEERVNLKETFIKEPLPSRPMEKIAVDLYKCNGKCQSNGAAEAAVKIAKSIIKKNKNRNIDVALLNYRATPLENGYSPGELMMGRKLKTLLPQLPGNLNSRISDADITKILNFEDDRKEKQRYYYEKRHRSKDLSELKKGDRVWIIDIRKYGKIVREESNPRSYVVETDSGIYRRNRWHLIPAPYIQDHDIQNSPQIVTSQNPSEHILNSDSTNCNFTKSF